MRKLVVFILFTLPLWCVAQVSTPTVSVSGVAVKYCRPTTSRISLRIRPEDNWNGYTFFTNGVYVRTLTNAAGCDSIVTLDVTVLHGTLPGVFSVSKNDKVQFAQGNLQYNANPSSGDKVHNVITDTTAQGIFRFAANQYDYVGANNMIATATFGGWIDLLCYGTSGHDEVYPFRISNKIEDYPVARIDSTNYDWGVFNAISNGGNQPGLWFTLTYDQWQYLLNSRPNATSLKSYGKINNRKGVILLPDDWELPQGAHFMPLAADTTLNVYTVDEWEQMETAGAVFLPAVGRREVDTNGTTKMQYPNSCYYWSSTGTGGSAYYLYADTQSSITNITTSSGSTTYARPVRLVRWVY